MNTETTMVKEAEKEVSCPMSLIKKRDGQTFEEFRAERADTNRTIKHFIKGILFHSNENGTYNVGRNQMKRDRKLSNGTHKKVNRVKG